MTKEQQEKIERIVEELKWSVYDFLSNGSDWPQVKINIIEVLSGLPEFQENPFQKHWKEMGMQQ
jgi:hypothetical protein